jgi:HAD superfamily hydrolase (TIGR01509 family)
LPQALKTVLAPGWYAVVTGDDVKRAKPSPDIFAAAARQLKVAISNCIVVGDSVWDLLAAVR